ncbi:hypothetical protein CEUSTIGMA_g8168.t1 [Chlamydomonas eustigma]|uniref:CASTOR/POLLUX/SYM8 ion channel conserved domain-containing protein n=1 Tax=Chlamydomonas eustigma TaxID=1157962 RepID=A0A250XCB9_9CHLO|nr:hypothetical protein CEUSTIGMA_g8168.t1 [Chlamydomonas eustigma]|eukprot:GAX80733.1 hypothetical protein CEUSTIGMA_g8168.t1 [Chlamydomonas eustigma]
MSPASSSITPYASILTLKHSTNKDKFDTNHIILASSGAPLSKATKGITNTPVFIPVVIISVLFVLLFKFKNVIEGLLVQFRYQLLKLFSLPTIGKLAFLLVFTVPIILVGGSLYNVAAGTESWTEGFHKVYHTVTGFPEVEEESMWAKQLMSILNYVGMFAVASVIGFVSSDVSGAIERINTGNHNLLEKQHTVLLGWNKQTIPLLKQILLAQEERGYGTFNTPLIILADKCKEDMDSELKDELGTERLNTWITTRSGSPTRKSDLERVATGSARTVVIMASDEGASSLSTVLANITAVATVSQKVVLESGGGMKKLEDTGPGLLLQQMALTGNFSVVSVPSLSNLSDLVAQCATQPGMSAVFLELVTHDEGKEFYVQHVPSLVGKTFGEARRMFDGATLCGMVDSRNGKHQLNPDDGVTLGPSDSVLLLAGDARALKPSTKAINCEAIRATTEGVTAGSSAVEPSVKEFKEVMVICPSCDIPSELLDSLREFGQEGMRINVLLDKEAGTTSPESEGGERSKISYTNLDLESVSALIDEGLSTVDSVVVSLDQDQEGSVADAQVVATVVKILGALSTVSESRTKPVGIVCCIADPDTTNILKELLATFLDRSAPGVTLDVIEYRTLLGGMVTQIGAEPLLQPVFADLFDEDGDELYMQSLAHYGVPVSQSFMWGQIQEAVRANGDLLLGYLAKGGSARLSVPRSESVTLSPEDSLVVLAKGA